MNYYFDMDGVLFTYHREAYVGDPPPFLVKGTHHFRDLEPDRKILELIDTLHQKSRYTGDEIYILTSIMNNGAIFNEHFHDKIVSLAKWVPYIDIDHILISVTSKRDAVEYIQNHNLTMNDVLIDDYNKNLNDWKNAGGTAIKYCNGINSPGSFNGPRISYIQSVKGMIETLENEIIINEEKGE